jgi:hypothetical protein
MTEKEDTGEGFRVLDGLALVIGAAVAAVHVRGILRDNLSGPGWVMIWITFAWVSLTAAGPFMYLGRRFASRLTGYPNVGDALWALLGLPWLATALLRSAVMSDGNQGNDLTSMGLAVGLAIVSLIALAVIWNTWVLVPPERAERTAATPWTNRVGLVLSVAWPVQCGLGMVVAD